MTDKNDWAARREASKKARKKNAVLKYLVILFAAAFVLLAFSMFAQYRANKIAIENLEQTSNSAAQTLDNILAERDQLKQDKLDLQAENASLHSDLKKAEKDAADSKRRADNNGAQLDALSQLNQLRALYNRKQYRDARALLDQWEAENPGLMEHSLEQFSKGLTEEERQIYDPAQAYQNIISWIGWDG